LEEDGEEPNTPDLEEALKDRNTSPEIVEAPKVVDEPRITIHEDD